MVDWGKAYKSGFFAAVNRLMNPPWSNEECSEWAEKNIGVAKDGKGPSYYAVANHCCGGVDAHGPGCDR